MPFRCVVFLYNLLLPLAILLLLPRQLVKMVRRGNYQRHFAHRFGSYSPETRAWLRDHPAPLWIHAVSVGEVLVALKLIRALRAQAPALPIVLSCTTTTGFEQAEKHAGLGFLPLYRPIDLPLCVYFAFQAIQPRLLVLVESELWPNTIAAAAIRRIPIALVNARLSPRSERRFRWFGLLSRPLFEKLDLVLTQTEGDVDRWASLGVARERIHHSGSIKFDQEGAVPPAQLIAEFRALLENLRGAANRGPVLLAGSTHSGEEKLLGQAVLAIREQFPEAFFIVVPRHFERGEEVRQELSSLGFAPVLKKSLDSAPPPAASAHPCLIVNTTGELNAWYHLADIVFIGKTFLSNEGQNPVEPLLAGKPVISGPEMRNFEELFARLRSVGGVLRLDTLQDLIPATRRLLEAPDLQRQIVANGRAVVLADQGAAARSAEHLQKVANRPAIAESHLFA